jgi:glycerol-3-phosphate acyltransferase PlsY
MVIAVATFVIAYLIGAINPAAIIARVRGVNLRASGSGNPGATNAGRILGRRTGVLVGLLDVLKGFVPAVLAGWLLGSDYGLLAGFAAFLGHVTSPFLRFRGGKGVATAGGAILGTNPIWLIPVLVVAALVFGVSRRVGMASVAGALTLIPTAMLLNDSWQETAFAIAMALVIVIRHQLNIRAAVSDALTARRRHREGRAQSGPSTTTDGSSTIDS